MLKINSLVQLSGGLRWNFKTMYGGYTVKRPILKSNLMRQIVPLEYIKTLLKGSIPKKPR
jgi:hypothetical protein